MKQLSYLFTSVKSSSPVLYWNTMIILFLAVVSFMGLLVDDRSLMGINVWIKPLKFTISSSIYMLTVGFLINFYPYTQRKKTVINGIVAWTLLIEMLIIPFQAARGVQSHFNQSNIFDGVLFGCMGLLILVNFIIMVLFLVDTIRLKLKTNKSMQWAIFLGWLVVIFGSWVGGQMISQMSHSIGVADGGEGLPFLNWSTKGGDLRIAHFFGLHGIQIIPLFALWASNMFHKSTKNQIIAITLYAVLYGGWLAYVFYQAKQAIPFIAVN